MTPSVLCFKKREAVVSLSHGGLFFDYSEGLLAFDMRFALLLRYADAVNAGRAPFVTRMESAHPSGCYVVGPVS